MEAEIGWIAAIIIGGLAGWFAEMFMKSGTGILMNICSWHRWRSIGQLAFRSIWGRARWMARLSDHGLHRSMHHYLPMARCSGTDRLGILSFDWKLFLAARSGCPEAHCEHPSPNGTDLSAGFRQAGFMPRRFQRKQSPVISRSSRQGRFTLIIDLKTGAHLGIRVPATHMRRRAFVGGTAVWERRARGAPVSTR